jgi:hypothetical protein
MGPDASRSVDPSDAGDGAVERGLADSDRPIGTGAPRSVDPVGAYDSMGPWGESERTKCNHDGQHNVFHLKMTPAAGF